MNSIKTRKAAEAMTSQKMTSAPSTAFGMSVCGHVIDVSVTADLGLAARTYRGSHAWSPPTS